MDNGDHSLDDNDWPISVTPLGFSILDLTSSANILRICWLGHVPCCLGMGGAMLLSLSWRLFFSLFPVLCWRSIVFMFGVRGLALRDVYVRVLPLPNKSR